MEMQSLPLPAFEKKVLALHFSPQELNKRLQAFEKPIVFTNGVFDILHRGHVTYLAQARALGKSLIVGVNTDQSVKMLGKGEDRPINNEADRMALLAALECVDLVVCFQEKTPVEIIEQIRPDIYVKGGDYHIDSLPETALIKTWGGKAYAIPFLFERSTTQMLKKIRN
jgi:rfaE bifunctional protein nucleotidyltransferase chain/domain